MSTPTAVDLPKTGFDAELQRIYDSEINVTISWFWDCGITVRLGDEMNGFVAEECVQAFAEVIPWLQEAIAYFYPQSTYTASLSAQIREQAANRVFVPPKIGSRHICPHCGAPNTSRMDESFIYISAHCGESVEVEPPKIQ